MMMEASNNKPKQTKSSPKQVVTSPSHPPSTTVQVSRYRQFCRFLLDLLLFYTTAFFVLLAIISLFALVFLVPFFIDPAWSTLQADFDPNGSLCTTYSGKYLEGRSVCDWSSCQEGCTKTVYTCWQVIVEYEIPGINPGSDMEHPTAKGKLFPNVKGCGYPPQVDCQNFMKTYGAEGSNFTCYVSRTNPDLIVATLDLQEVKDHLFYSLAVPIPCLLISIFYLVIAYKFIYNDKKDKQDYRPVASAAAGSAFAALIDMRDSEESDLEKERQRKLLLQIQRTKWLASHGKLSTSSSVASGISSEKSSSKSGGGLDLSKYGSVRMKELQEAHISGYEAQNVDKKASHMEMIHKDRSTYGTEKHQILHYYQYYNQQ